MNLFDDRGAIFSDDGVYRYRLWRIWDASQPYLNCLMLNPSTADVEHNDPTVERCERRARRDGWGGLHVTNLFAYRATDPRAMLAAADPVGPDNDAHILQVAQGAGMVLCAWGAYGSHMAREYAVLRLLDAYKIPLHVLGLTTAGGYHPRHPLYLPNGLEPFVWRRSC